MSDDLEQLRAIRRQTLALIALLTADPKPSYSVDGQAVSWESYLARLRQTVDWCDQKLGAAEPIEIATRGVT